MDLNEALDQLDRVEANLRRLEGVWNEMEELIPPGVRFLGGSPEDARYKELRRAFADILRGLPPIDGWSLEAEPLLLDEIAQFRLDAQEIGEMAVLVDAENETYKARDQIAEYRSRFSRARAQLVRGRAEELIGQIDELIARLVDRVLPDGNPWDDDEWAVLAESVAEIERLVGQAAQGGRWSDLSRHLSFGQAVDLQDIATMDWPSVRPRIEAALYTEFEPLPVEIADIAALVQSKPAGKVSTALSWDRLDPEDFERLIFNLISDAAGYENPRWLMQTNAPDRGRDLSVDRIQSDSLGGITRQRVIIQCKHLGSRSVNTADVSGSVGQMNHWEPPPVHVLVVATSGRFSADAVAWIEQHNNLNRQPSVEMWPESHLESLLAARPHLVAEFRLRQPGAA